VLRKTFGLKREEVAGDWRRLHNEDVRNLFASPNIIRGSSQRRMRAGHVARMDGEMHAKFWSEDLGVDGRISESTLGK